MCYISIKKKSFLESERGRDRGRACDPAKFQHLVNAEGLSFKTDGHEYPDCYRIIEITGQILHQT